MNTRQPKICNVSAGQLLRIAVGELTKVVLGFVYPASAHDVKLGSTKTPVRSISTLDTNMPTLTCICVQVPVDVIRRRVVWGIAPNVRVSLPLVYPDIIDMHFGRERHRARIHGLERG